MTDFAIRLDNVEKMFDLTLGAPLSLKAAVLSFKKSKKQTLHALKGVSFEIGCGETVAVVGRNGSGKSTLLRIIGRVYKATSGTVQVNGSMSTMLDLGAGFHPDLTGRENIYFNGAIMGLPTAKINERIDRIVEFSELEEFVDAPVRTYSAGMLMRLGFAIATEIEPDILLVDEVLAVGDATFQEKCYARIEDFQKNGKTIVFVTHDLEAARAVASRAIWIHKGDLRMDGPTDEVIDHYLGEYPTEDLHTHIPKREEK